MNRPKYIHLDELRRDLAMARQETMNDAAPFIVDPMAHEYTGETQSGYAVCSLCGRIENSATSPDNQCWKKLLDKAKRRVIELEMEQKRARSNRGPDRTRVGW